MKVKEQSTGDNDSLEDIFISMGRLKTYNGLLLSTREAWKIVKQFANDMGLDNE